MWISFEFFSICKVVFLNIEEVFERIEIYNVWLIR